MASGCAWNFMKSEDPRLPAVRSIAWLGSSCLEPLSVFVLARLQLGKIGPRWVRRFPDRIRCHLICRNFCNEGVDSLPGGIKGCRGQLLSDVVPSFPRSLADNVSWTPAPRVERYPEIRFGLISRSPKSMMIVISELFPARVVVEIRALRKILPSLHAISCAEISVLVGRREFEACTADAACRRFKKLLDRSFPSSPPFLGAFRELLARWTIAFFE